MVVTQLTQPNLVYSAQFKKKFSNKIGWGYSRSTLQTMLLKNIKFLSFNIQNILTEKTSYESVNFNIQNVDFHGRTGSLVYMYLVGKANDRISRYGTQLYLFFFSVPVPFKEKMKQKHANAKAPVDTSRGEMLNTTRKLLVDFYRPYNVKMYRLMRDPAFLYHLSL